MPFRRIGRGPGLRRRSWGPKQVISGALNGPEAVDGPEPAPTVSALTPRSRAQVAACGAASAQG
jgi:hypothetical protein